MYQNLHAYRNLGVSCLIAECSFCSKVSVHSVYFELDRQRRKVCSLGCTQCGRARSLSETQYEALYQASFEFDSWREGETDFETFKESLPEEFQKLAREEEKERSEADWKCQDCGESVPANMLECWNCSFEREGSGIGERSDESNTEIQRSGESETEESTSIITLNNGIGPLLSFGVSLGFALQIVVVGLLFLDLLPNVLGIWKQNEGVESGAWGYFLWMPITMLVSVFLGGLLSYRRFPKQLRLSPEQILIKPRGTRADIRYGFEELRQTRYGKDSKYLTLWFTDGNAYLFRLSPEKSIELRQYFQASD